MTDSAAQIVADPGDDVERPLLADGLTRSAQFDPKQSSGEPDSGRSSVTVTTRAQSELAPMKIVAFEALRNIKAKSQKTG